MANGDSVSVTGPDGKSYQFPSGTTKDGAVAYFKKKGIGAAQTPPVEKAMPFSSGVVSGMMLDPTEIAKHKTFLGQAGEVGKEMGSGSLDFLKSVAKDPLNVGNPIDAIVKGQRDSYKKIHEGLTTGDHDKLMNGLGEAVGNLSMIIGGAKSSKGWGVAEGARDSAFAAKDLMTKRAIVSAASHESLNNLRTQHLSTLDTALKSEKARIGGNVAAINVVDKARNPSGYAPKALVAGVIEQAINDKNAKALEAGKQLPGTSAVKKLLGAYGNNLTFDNIKDLHSVIGDSLSDATGKDRAILGDLYDSFSRNMKGRAAQLGKLPEFEEYNNATKALSEHQKGILHELKGTQTGLQFMNEVSRPSNVSRLTALAKDLHLPDDFFDKTNKDYKTIHKFAKLTETDSTVGRVTNRLIALKGHPLAALPGGAIGTTIGRAVGTAVGSPMAGSFVGFTLGAAAAADLADKMDAAKAIRELGGPSNVGFGVGRNRPPSGPQGGAPPSGGPTTPPQGPAGPGLTPGGGSQPTPPVRPAGLSPALEKLLPPSPKEIIKGAGDISDEAKEKQVLEGSKTEVRNNPFSASRKYGVKGPLYRQTSLSNARAEISGGVDATGNHVTPNRELALSQTSGSKIVIELSPDIAVRPAASKPGLVGGLKEFIIHGNPNPGPKDILAIHIEKGMNVEKVKKYLGASGGSLDWDKAKVLEDGSTRIPSRTIEITKVPEGQRGREDFTSQIKEFTDVIRDPKSSQEQIDVARQLRSELREKRRAFNKQELDNILGSMKSKIREAADKHYQESIPLESALEDMGKKLTGKVPEEARGREPSSRAGMTKDTPEARRAKDAERVAKAREEAGRTKVKTSLDEQARQIAGKVTSGSLQNLNIVDIEDAAKELDHTSSKMIYKGMQSLRKKMKWSDEVYRGYLEDFILKSIDMKSGKGN